MEGIMSNPTEQTPAEPEVDFLTLNAELKALPAEQLEGKWEKQPEEAEDAWATRQQLKVRRCIEITQILRRTNTGPAKPAKGRGKKQVNLQAITDELLS